MAELQHGGNITDYLLWRGDMTLRQRPFNIVDNLVLAYLSYYNFQGIVPALGVHDSITVREAVERVGKMYGFGTGPESEFLPALAGSARFGSAKLSDYVDIYADGELKTQFAALTVSLCDGTCYISFRGTGDSIVGWREDFEISYRLTEAQMRSTEYLNRCIPQPKFNRKRFLIGGHSKGGNLAVYSAVTCDPAVRDRILHVYSNDGPGLCPETTSPELLHLLDGRYTKIVAEYDLIGMLFEEEVPGPIVRSTYKGIMQHDLISWQVLGTGLVTAENFTDASLAVQQTFNRWIRSVDLKGRETFTTDLFDSFEAGGALYMSDLKQQDFEGFQAVLTAMLRAQPTSIESLGKFFASVRETAKGLDYRELLRENIPFENKISSAVNMITQKAKEYAEKFEEQKELREKQKQEKRQIQAGNKKEGEDSTGTALRK